VRVLAFDLSHRAVARNRYAITDSHELSYVAQVAVEREGVHVCSVATCRRPRDEVEQWLTPIFRGSKFLKLWMEFLEEEADLRYPNIADLQQGG
jgi:hypothetical protein